MHIIDHKTLWFFSAAKDQFEFKLIEIFELPFLAFCVY